MWKQKDIERQRKRERGTYVKTERERDTFNHLRFSEWKTHFELWGKLINFLSAIKQHRQIHFVCTCTPSIIGITHFAIKLANK
jgi:hypothetical protein